MKKLNFWFGCRISGVSDGIISLALRKLENLCCAVRHVSGATKRRENCGVAGSAGLGMGKGKQMQDR